MHASEFASLVARIHPEADGSEGDSGRTQPRNPLSFSKKKKPLRASNNGG